MPSRLAFLYRAWRYRLKVEPAEVRLVIAALAPGDCAVDIGAHRGGYLYWMQKGVGPRGRVFAFEPQAELAAYLRSIVAQSGLAQVTVEELAISDAEGEATLQVPDGGPACGATLEPGLVTGPSSSRGVRTVTLDGYFEPFRELRIRLIKCDAEGHELRILRGAEKLLRAQGPLLIFECEARHRPHGSVAEVFDWLAAIGYCGHFFRGRECHAIAQFDPARHGIAGSPDYVNNFVFHARGAPPPARLVCEAEAGVSPRRVPGA